MSLFGDDDLPDDFMDLIGDDADADVAADEPPRVTGLDKVDLAKVDPCPNCGVPVRRMPSVPVSGHGLDATPCGPWWCSACIQAKCSAAYAAVRSVDTTAPLD